MYDTLDKRQQEILRDFLEKRAYYYTDNDNSYSKTRVRLACDLGLALTGEDVEGWHLSSKKPYQNGKYKVTSENVYGAELEKLSNAYVLGAILSVMMVPTAMFGIFSGLANVGMARKIHKTRLENNKYAVPAAFFAGLLNFAIIIAIMVSYIHFSDQISDISHALDLYCAILALSISLFSAMNSCMFFSLACSKIYDKWSATNDADCVWQKFAEGGLDDIIKRMAQQSPEEGPQTDLGDPNVEPQVVPSGRAL